MLPSLPQRLPPSSSLPRWLPDRSDRTGHSPRPSRGLRTRRLALPRAIHCRSRQPAGSGRCVTSGTKAAAKGAA